MTKTFLAMMVCVSSLSVWTANAKADTQKDYVSFTYEPKDAQGIDPEEGELKKGECKVSIDELLHPTSDGNGINGYICAHIDAIGGFQGGGIELTPMHLNKMTNWQKEGHGQLNICYSGTDSNQALETLQSWAKYIVEDDGAAEFTVTAKRIQGDVLTVEFTGADKNVTGISFDLDVKIAGCPPRKVTAQ